jgi:MYXO-CTERM domain-containing protein
MTSLVAIGLLAMPGIADTTLTQMQGTLGNPFNDGQLHGWGWNGVDGDGASFGLGNLYDNVLTINGGAATSGICPPFQTCRGEAFVDWVGSAALWGDDLHGISAGTGQPAVVQTIYYGYSNGVATTTHIIKIYDMLTPSTTPTVTTLVTKGALLSSVVLPSQPTGIFMVQAAGLNITGVGSSAWIKFEETGPGFPGTFWLSGGIGNGVGTTNPGVTFSYEYPDGGVYNLWLPLPYFYFTTTGYVASNIQVALSGFHVPAPAVMSLLGLAGLVTLRRRHERHTRR